MPPYKHTTPAEVMLRIKSKTSLDKITSALSAEGISFRLVVVPYTGRKGIAWEVYFKAAV